MKIKDVLRQDCVCADLTATTKDEAIQQLVNLLIRGFSNLSRDELSHILLEREKLGSTGIGNGVAIPHGKISTIDHVITGFGRSLQGVPFDAQDGKPVNLFFVLVAPENAASLHLKTLARLSRLLKDSTFRHRLLESKTDEEIYQAIIDEDEKYQ
ncbi:MAG: PTS fructose transporter subunit IIA [Deltaproteobacteria bacterium RIFCSPLOWO2_02_FULL_50_16]|nr:MAG: PTS fructose transporter subunit IIA [Deltaproteobacteria bacterium GWA2_50_8]OGQ29417.1 MAG: PTS fructose transporter subunit IIA [Deltaproteobacteria bacterium RIFCSPHIGHO2_02_FULL_50_15]OGQ56058.1 MAG: PTS fructose transporter subunit IIA [Deltaproteobacteria bacterium RIFCSPLOWO2_02_FULL_50_16]OGQ68324.1 MAG: PTS fructose transporter subunit IIA [Deltaproteobacteria bacterium RIFCSPLOWO2_12_FULL_50_11]